MKIYLIAFSALMLFVLLSCDPARDYVAPEMNSKIQGVVVQTPVANGTHGLILLKDGRIITPQTGFDPAIVNVGSKFLFSFKQKTKNANVYVVDVTDFSIDTAMFADHVLSLADTALVKFLLQGNHHGTAVFGATNYPTSDTTNAFVRVEDFTLHVEGNIFEASATYAPVPAGNGNYFFDMADKNYRLDFKNTAYFPPSTQLPKGFLLNGKYNYSPWSNYLAVWKYQDDSYATFIIDR